MDTNTTPQTSQPVESTQKKESFIGDILKFAIFALAIVLPIRLFVAQPFIVSGASMDPTFESGEYLIVDQLSYRVGEPERGQVAIFKYPKDESKYFIKRIIGLPGETVIIDGSSVTIKNKDNPEGFKLNEPYIAASNTKKDTVNLTLRTNQYFVMGDNRKDSFDSRSWGVLRGDLLVGKPFVRLYPITKISLFPGNFKEAK